MCHISSVNRAFPIVRWGDEDVTFDIECSESLAPLVVVLVWVAGGFALANIQGRGWCTPSGRVEKNESHLQAAFRETREETGIELDDLERLGCFRFSDAAGSESHVPAYLGVGAATGIPCGTDSIGASVVSMEELPERYYRWDALLHEVFNYAACRVPKSQ